MPVPHTGIWPAHSGSFLASSAGLLSIGKGVGMAKDLDIVDELLGIAKEPDHVTKDDLGDRILVAAIEIMKLRGFGPLTNPFAKLPRDVAIGSMALVAQRDRAPANCQVMQVRTLPSAPTVVSSQDRTTSSGGSSVWADTLSVRTVVRRLVACHLPRRGGSPHLPVRRALPRPNPRAASH
jgi:hypothetical protein